MAKIVRVKKVAGNQSYTSVRMPTEAYKDFMKRKEKMREVVRSFGADPRKITLTKVFKISARAPIQLQDEELIAIAKKRRRG